MSLDGAVRLSVIVVTHNSSAALAAALPPLIAQLGPHDELVIVDNDSSDETLSVVLDLAPAATVIETGGNVGFAAAANAGAAIARGDLLVFLNPDATAAPDFAEAIAAPLRDDRGWTAWMGLVTAESRKRCEHERRRHALHGHRLGGRGGKAGARNAGRPARGRLPLGCVPRHPARAVGSRRRFRGGVLHVPRGRRPLAPAATGGRTARGGADGDRRPRLRVRQRPGQVASCSSATAGPRSCAVIQAGCWSCSPRRCSPPSWRS